MIFCRNDGVYHICISIGSYYNFIYDITLASFILSELHHLQADLTRFICIYITCSQQIMFQVLQVLDIF